MEGEQSYHQCLFRQRCHQQQAHHSTLATSTVDNSGTALASATAALDSLHLRPMWHIMQARSTLLLATSADSCYTLYIPA